MYCFAETMVVLCVELFLCFSVCLHLFSPEESSHTVKVASYILIGVGSLSMAMGFFGCIGAIYEIRCLLGLVRNYFHVKLQCKHATAWRLSLRGRHMVNTLEIRQKVNVHVKLM